MNNTVIFLIGPSGSGKSTLENNLTNYKGFSKAISTTTRSPRGRELDGYDYNFISNEQFDKLDLVQQVEYVGNRYGNTASEFNKSEYVVFVCTYDGIKAIKGHFGESKKYITVFFDINNEVLIKNMTYRGDDYDKIMNRINNCSIVEDFKRSGEKPDIVVTESMLNEELHKNVHKLIIGE